VHEASIALAIVGEVCERAHDGGIARIAAVHVRIGSLTSVVPEALCFAWDAATGGTPAEGARLVIEAVPLRISCTQCDGERDVKGALPICPNCNTTSTRIVRGRELLVTAMEVVYDAAAARRPAEHSAQEHYAGA
jgi:hydrogenase nickel incorporation protein HypA/HybF